MDFWNESLKLNPNLRNLYDSYLEGGSIREDWLQAHKLSPALRHSMSKIAKTAKIPIKSIKDVYKSKDTHRDGWRAIYKFLKGLKGGKMGKQEIEEPQIEQEVPEWEEVVNNVMAGIQRRDELNQTMNELEEQLDALEGNQPHIIIIAEQLAERVEQVQAEIDANNEFLTHWNHWAIWYGNDLLAFEANFAGNFVGQGKAHDIPLSYLKEARQRAKEHGYNPQSLELSDDKIHKLQIRDKEGRLVRFGRKGYGDFILWKHREKQGLAPKGFAVMKKGIFHKSHEKMRGNWKSNDFSPNNLALRILW